MRVIDLSYRNLTISELEDAGIQIPDSRPTPEQEAEIAGEREQLLAALTEKQSFVFQKLADGFTRREIASEMNVCIQAVYQIGQRIKHRLQELKHIQPLTREQKRRLKEKRENSRNCVYLFFLSNPQLKAERLLSVWDNHPVLKIYYKPTLFELREWLEDFYNERH